MLLDAGFLTLMQSTGLQSTDKRPRQRVVVITTARTETPLPERLTPTFLPDAPTGLTKAAPSMLSALPAAHARLLALGEVVRIDPTAQALVDRLVLENTPPRGSKRPLPRHPR